MGHTVPSSSSKMLTGTNHRECLLEATGPGLFFPWGGIHCLKGHWLCFLSYSLCVPIFKKNLCFSQSFLGQVL